MQPFRKLVPARVYLLSAFEAALVAACYLAATFMYMPLEAEIYLRHEDGTLRIGLAVLTFIIASYLFDFYKQLQARSRLVLALQVSQLIGVTMVVQAAIGFINLDLLVPRPVVFLASAMMLVVLTSWRLFVRPVFWDAFGAQQVVFVGTDSAIDDLAEAFRARSSLGMNVVGYIVEPDIEAPPGPLLGSYPQLIQIISDIRPDRIIVSSDRVNDKRLLKALFDLKTNGAQVETSAQAYEAVFARIYGRGLEPYAVIFRNDLAARPLSVAIQSIYTNLLALSAVIFILPVVLLIAIFSKVTIGGPVFTKYACVGLHGIPFNMYRFRVTGTGYLSRFLTRFHLDGLPQALNMIRGEMALTGPRAERVESEAVLSELIPFYRQRQYVKPGILGWSQLHCDPEPTENTFARIEYDLYYIKHISLALDAYIVVRALKWILSDNQEEMA
jgi:lipopolysaccharide/colanic/teichoic acid biosynthesis glycosyltransferase